MQKITPIIAIGIGIYSALGIWFPDLRAHWKGSPIKCGALSCAGFGLFFSTIGLTFLFGDSIPEPHRIWLIFPGIIGWILAAAGHALDARAHSRNSSMFSPFLTQVRERTARTERRSWLFVAFGIFFLLTIIWTFVFHK